MKTYRRNYMYAFKNTNNRALIAKELFLVVMEIFPILFEGGSDTDELNCQNS